MLDKIKERVKSWMQKPGQITGCTVGKTMGEPLV